MVTTPPMPATVILNISNRVTFQVTTPDSPLFLRTLHVTPTAPAGSGAIGSVSPGTSGSPATHTFDLGSTKFAQVRSFLQSHPGAVALLITYDSTTFTAFDFETTTPPALRAAATA